MRDYGKLHTSFWTSDDITALSDDAKMLAAYLLTGPHTTLIGCFRLPDGYVSEDLRWDIERVSKGFDELLENGFATRDKDTKWVVIHKFLKWNEIENPNQGKAALKVYEQVPDQSSVKPILAQCLSEFARHFPVEKLNPFVTVTQTVSKPEAGAGAGAGAGTGTGTEEETTSCDHPADGSPEPVENPKKKNSIPYQAIVDAYHELLPMCPGVAQITAKRKGQISARWNSGALPSLETWREYFAYCATSKFLTGCVDPQAGRKRFVADIEWLTNETNFTKVWEGKYHG